MLIMGSVSGAVLAGIRFSTHFNGTEISLSFILNAICVLLPGSLYCMLQLQWLMHLSFFRPSLFFFLFSLSAAMTHQDCFPVFSEKMHKLTCKAEQCSCLWLYFIISDKVNVLVLSGFHWWQVTVCFFLIHLFTFAYSANRTLIKHQKLALWQT